MIYQLACTSLRAAQHFIIGVILRNCSTIIIFTIVAHFANSVARSVMHGVIFYKVSRCRGADYGTRILGISLDTVSKQHQLSCK